MNASVESPFHRGEQILQERAGVRERMEHFGRRVIRDHFPDQHREFYGKLPFVVLGYSDDEGWPWVSVIAGNPGFMLSDDPRTLTLKALPVEGDPLLAHLRNGLAIGGLGLEPHTRRRNRFSVQATGVSDDQFSLSVRQTFGNCPQYIQAHELHYAPTPNPGAVEQLSALDSSALALIERSDTFFVASQTLDDDQRSTGADVSHRGGKPGFVKVEQKDGGWLLTVPDYPGNNHFNTLGNFLVNPRAGLLFWDLDSQDVLLLTGEVTILEEHEELPFFENAERFWQFRVHKAVRLNGRLPLRGKLGEYSPNTLMTGDWESARKAAAADRRRHEFQSYEVIGRVEETESVVSVYLKPKDGSLLSFEAGQFLTVKMPLLKDSRGRPLVRTYTVSNAPGEGSYRISVKRLQNDDEQGLVSNYIHRALKIGDVIEAKAPQGDFHWQANSSRPAVLLAAGIGITPMVSMVRHGLREQLRLRKFQTMTLIVVVRNGREKIFHQELQHLLKSSQGYLRICWCFTQPDQSDKQGADYQVQGRPDTSLLQSLLPLADYDFYLCGPGAFMRDMHTGLRELGVQESRILSEAFGPSSLLPTPEAEASEKNTSAASHSQLTLQDARGKELFSLSWSYDDGHLLDFVEQHGVEPASGCRTGRCGTCAATLVSGSVVYDEGTRAPSEDQLLLCCSRPASEDEVVIRLPES